ncbi:helix-turn-helix domain-containing protein [Acinetobacter baumannii]|nr:protein ninH [Acinetobacter baumannii]WPE82760.1 helix-turn-helix domain-containing protein [Acinetobacter baumannii]
MSSKLTLQSPVLTIEHLNHVLETEKDNAYNVVMELVEKPLLDLTLTHTRGNQTKAAELLGLNRGTLRKKLKAHGLMK